MSNFDFADDNRYATDCGPQCTKCKCAVDDDTLWLYLCQWPYSHILGQCAVCHDVIWFPLIGTTGVECPPARPSIADLKAAHRRWLATRVGA